MKLLVVGDSYMPVEVFRRAFDRLGRLQDLTTADYLANTLALVEPLQTAAPHIAVMSGWSAIESLLVGPADREDIVAARRFSLIIAASLMRAEFTLLAKTYTAENDDALIEAVVRLAGPGP